MQIGFIGTGVMGKSIVRHLLKNGHQLSVYNRTKQKTDDLVAEGAIWQDSPKLIAQTCELVFSMVGYPQDVENIYFGTEGIFAANVENKILVDLTTSTPALAQKIAAEAQTRKAESLDAPVSGGDLGAQKGTLTIMVGGSEEVYEKVLPVFKNFGQTIQLQGAAGSGQHTKMANQIMIAGTMTGMSELLVYADKAGLSLTKVLETVGGGSAANWSLTNYAPRILKNDYSPGFFVKHFIKDLGIALEEAKRLEIDLPSTKQAHALYEQLANNGGADFGTQALIKLWWSDEKCLKISEENASTDIFS